MNGLNGFTRSILLLADRIAGPERREWIAAMAAETEAAGRHGAGWALGCLAAALRDRLERDGWFWLALAGLPGLSLVLAVALTLAAVIGARALGISMLATVPLMLLGPLPAAWLLGRMRPRYAPLLIGTLAFLVHQIVPLLGMWALTGTPPHWFWSPNVTYYNMPATTGIFMSWLTWVGGVWWGGRRRAGRAAGRT